MNKFKNALISIFKSVTKQKTILIMSVMAAVLIVCRICIDMPDYEPRYLWDEIWFSFLFGTLCSIPAAYLTEKMVPLKKYLIQAAAAVFTTGGMFLLVHFVKTESYRDMFALGICFAVLCFTIFVLVPKENNQSYYANIFKYSIFCELIASLVFDGCVLLFEAFSFLLTEFEDQEKILLSIFVFSQVIVFVNLYVYFVFEKRQEPSGKAFKIIVMYVMFPVYALLLVILYCYLLKMLFTWSVPNGQINWFVSFATAFYMLIYFLLQEYRENKVMQIFYKYGAIVMLPLVVVQFWAYFVRLNAYGFTGWRYTSLLYNIFAAVFLIFTFIKNGKFVRFAIPVLGAIGILATLTPVNLINVAYNSQFNRLTKVMAKYGLWENGQPHMENKENLSEKITDEDREKLSGAYEYLTDTAYKVPEWIEKYESFENFFGISRDASKDEIVNFREDYQVFKKTVDISGYSRMIKLSSYYSGESYGYETEYRENVKILEDFDITEELLKLKPEDENFIIEKEDGTRILFDFCNYHYDKEKKSFSYYNLEYYVLYKQIFF